MSALGQLILVFWKCSRYTVLKHCVEFCQLYSAAAAAVTVTTTDDYYIATTALLLLHYYYFQFFFADQRAIFSIIYLARDQQWCERKYCCLSSLILLCPFQSGIENNMMLENFKLYVIFVGTRYGQQSFFWVTYKQTSWPNVGCVKAGNVLRCRGAISRLCVSMPSLSSKLQTDPSRQLSHQHWPAGNHVW